MSDITRDAKRGKLGFFLVLVLIALGSALILFPAWLPSSQTSTHGEDGIVEMLQLVLLILSAALYFAASPHAGKLKAIFFALGIGLLAAAIGEYSRQIESLLPVNVDWVVLALLIWVAVLFLTNLKAFSRFWGYASKSPSAGFMLAGIINAYIFGEVFGSKQFWEASLEGGYHPDTPKVVESYLELLACYFIFISSLGFCIPVTKRERNPYLKKGAHE